VVDFGRWKSDFGFVEAVRWTDTVLTSLENKLVHAEPRTCLQIETVTYLYFWLLSDSLRDRDR